MLQQSSQSLEADSSGETSLSNSQLTNESVVSSQKLEEKSPIKKKLKVSKFQKKLPVNENNFRWR